MQYLYSGKIQIQKPWAKCRDNRSSEQLRHARQLLKLVPFEAPDFPLIAGDLEGPEQLSNDLTPRLDRQEFKFLGCCQSCHAQSCPSCPPARDPPDENRAGAIAPWRIRHALPDVVKFTTSGNGWYQSPTIPPLTSQIGGSGNENGEREEKVTWFCFRSVWHLGSGSCRVDTRFPRLTQFTVLLIAAHFIYFISFRLFVTFQTSLSSSHHLCT